MRAERAKRGSRRDIEAELDFQDGWVDSDARGTGTRMLAGEEDLLLYTLHASILTCGVHWRRSLEQFSTSHCARGSCRG